MNIQDIREHFICALKNEEFTIDRTGSKTIELIGASFIADEPSAFGTVNEEYVKSELSWYYSESNNINDIYGNDAPAPKAWTIAANRHGEINSNYGLLVFSQKYYSQFENVVDELSRNKDSRRATMVYTRPSIWTEYDDNGKSDFICTNAVTYYIRNNKVHCVVQMRSNDLIFGYKNDYAWQHHLLEGVQTRLNERQSNEYGLGDIHWQVQNLHIYSRHFDLVK